MLSPHVKVDDKAFRRQMGHCVKQIPYATSKAVNDTAWDSRKALARGLSSVFTTRTKWLDKGSAEEGGLRVEKATKKTLWAEVGSRDPFMRTQAVGGERLHKGQMQAVPLVGKGRPRATSRSLTRPSRWPGALLRKSGGKTFIGDPFKSGKQGVWARFAPTRKRKGWLRLLYNLENKIEIKARWPIKQTVTAVVAARWPVNAIAAIKHAIDTAR